jgi:alpha-L-arabinofuranosidase
MQNPMKNRLSLIITSTVMLSSAFAQSQPGRLTIDLEHPGIQVSPRLYGIFFEEINRAGEGGIYAEMVQNRSFEDDATVPAAWKTERATASLDKSQPLNASNPTGLRVEAQAGGGVVNVGFVGGGPRWNMREWQRDYLPKQPARIAVSKQKEYDVSLYARAQGSITLEVALKGADGRVLASKTISGVGEGWKKFSVSLTPGATDTNASLMVSCKEAGTFWLDMVSLFPKDTWKGRKNGLRADLMEKLAAMKPAFVRFPGGCFVEGFEIQNRVQWKKTIGDIAERPGHLNKNWGYYSSDGLGQLEYLQMCEDLGAEPLFVINCGMGHKDGGMYAVPMNEMGPFVQDALDAIEYANGPVTSQWGALRAKHGHPEPFHLRMMEIGNENGGPDYHERFALIFDAIKAKYPDMQMIANEAVPNRTPDMIDPHHYGDFESFLSQVTRFDTYDRSAPKVYFGEYAQTEDAGRGTLQAALGEAAFMTGLERNGDVVHMASYAPLLCDPEWRGWNPNAILFNQSQVYGTPSYWVQVLFASNRGDQILPVELDVPASAAPVIEGKVGVGTWNTRAEFKDIKVTKGGQTLFESDFSKGKAGWQTPRGQWSVVDGALRQTSDENGTLAMVGEPGWRDYTLTLKARKLSGAEGFLITFGTPNESRRSWWNLGGWGNASHGLESSGLNGARTNGSIEAGRWYDIRIEIAGSKAGFYLDGRLIHSVSREPLRTTAAVAGRDLKLGETILKFVNAGNAPQTIQIGLRGSKPGKIAGRAWILTSAGARDENSFASPNLVAPREEPLAAEGPVFTRTFPANSLTILRWK